MRVSFAAFFWPGTSDKVLAFLVKLAARRPTPGLPVNRGRDWQRFVENSTANSAHRRALAIRLVVAIRFLDATVPWP